MIKHSYVNLEQVMFKSKFYGHPETAAERWTHLIRNTNSTTTVRLNEYLPWISKADDTIATTISMVKRSSLPWANVPPASLHGFDTPQKESITSKTLVLDGAIFQLQNQHLGGISRVWYVEMPTQRVTQTHTHTFRNNRSQLLPPLVRRLKEMKYDVLFLQRASGLRHTHRQFLPPETYLQMRIRYVPPLDTQSSTNFETERKMLARICHDVNASVFISTFYTSPIRSSKFRIITLIHDLIPEALSWDMSTDFQWMRKTQAIQDADDIVTVSRSTEKDFRKYYPEVIEKGTSRNKSFKKL